MLVARNVRTNEVKFFLSNADHCMKIRQLMRVAFSRWRIERCFQDCKTELGMNHAELRTYIGLHRHYILTAINYFFLQDWLVKHKNEDTDLTVSQCADAVQILLERKIEGIMTEDQLQVLAEKLADHITVTQMRNRAARESVTRRRIEQLKSMGINPYELPLCDECSL